MMGALTTQIIEGLPLLRPYVRNGIGYMLDPYIGCGHNCRFCANLPATPQPVGIHPDITRQLTEELEPLLPQPIRIGWSSDPYQPVEPIARQTRRVLSVLQGLGFWAEVVTRSDLILRDMALLAEMAPTSVGIVFTFQNDEMRRQFEPSAPTLERRLEVLHRLDAAGVATFAVIKPVMPYLTDVISLIERVAPPARSIHVMPLRVTMEYSEQWHSICRVLSYYYPGLQRYYRQMAFNPTDNYWQQLRESVAIFTKEHGLGLVWEPY